MKFLRKLKQNAYKLKKNLIVMYYAYQNPGTGIIPKIIILAALGYALSPIDFIPDFIPVLGYLDDLIIIPLLIFLAVKLIPKPVLEEAKKKAENEPIKLGKNWISALIFILIWIIIVIVVFLSVIRNCSVILQKH
jgi:uncharacterized membrane protein YkvA (DUF1232 family)